MNSLKRFNFVYKQTNIKHFNHNAQLSNIFQKKKNKINKNFSDNKHNKYNKTDSEELLFFGIINRYLIIITLPLMFDKYEFIEEEIIEYFD